MILVALSLLGAATVFFVLTPVFRPDGPAVPSLDAAGHELRELEEKKLRLYAAIKDLDFEKDAGKVSGDDYEQARDDYLGQVAEVLARIDTLKPPSPTAKKRGGGPPSQERESSRCSACGEASPVTAKFCIACGGALGLTCSACGTSLPAEAKFCLSCGTRVAS